MEKKHSKNTEYNFNLAEKLYGRIKTWDKSAYLYRDLSLTFEELKGESEKIANALLSYNVKSRDRVLLLMNDTPSFIAAFLACLQIGSIPVALNPKSKESSISHYIQDSEAKTIIGEYDNLSLITNSKIIDVSQLLLIVEDDYNDIGKHDFISLTEIKSGERLTEYTYLSEFDVAFMQYTSGTTGKPKAVMHTGMGMLEHAKIYGKKILEISNDDVVYSIAKVFFGYGLGNSFFFPIYYNVTAVLDSQWPTADIIYENIKKYKPSIFFAVPKIYGELLNYKHDVETLFSKNCRLISAGSHLPSGLYNAWKQRYKLTILDGVGTTEMGHIYLTSTYSHSKVNCLPGYEAKLADVKYSSEDGSESGVLMIKGPSQSLGYYKNIEKTQEKYQEGWFRTGDIFRKDADGYYTFEGREDDVFKVNGRWVSPVDIESFVMSHFSSVVDAALIKVDADTLDSNVVLFISTVNVNNEKDLCEKIIVELKSTFDSFCLPDRIEVLDDMPRNDNGKILRKELLSCV
ncbi:AMP-binding protein [Aliikangiella sp. IMCC44359]|uniref:AMP-binding protein n=1 Tax=Aliikangiella sp. IMCC44359 TaxID=3459125 RepID=UPI00403B29C6